jgi:hypothetical protein
LQTNFSQQKIFVVGDGSVFDEGVSHLLKNKTDLLVSHAIYSEDLSFLENIKSEQPEMILVNDSGSLNVERILEFTLSQLLMMDLRIVVVQLRDSVIDIYERPISEAENASIRSRRIIVRSQEDLFNAVINMRQ